MNIYLWATIILAAVFIVGVALVRRAQEARAPVITSHPKTPGGRDATDTEGRLNEALEEMRLRGIQTPEDFAAITGAARHSQGPPPDIPGFPELPRRSGEGDGRAKNRAAGERPNDRGQGNEEPSRR